MRSGDFLPDERPKTIEEVIEQQAAEDAYAQGESVIEASDLDSDIAAAALAALRKRKEQRQQGYII